MQTFESIDKSIYFLINGFAGKIASLDYFVIFISENYLVKGTVLSMVWWYFWFSKNTTNKIREKLISILPISVTAILIGRIIQITLQFSLRPLHTPGLLYNLPLGMSEKSMDGWSSFPSDHAVFFFCIAFAFIQISRATGLVLLLHAFFVISLPRIFLGLHYPSDIFYGALVGLLAFIIFNKPIAHLVGKSKAVEIAEIHPYAFYPVAFLVTFQIAAMFDPVRSTVSGLMRLIKMAVA
jgi:undecaprenyl-diphosphatase